MFRLFIIFVLISLPAISYSQIHGKVMDAENQAAIEGASISIENKVITATNNNGKFTIGNVSKNDTLLFEHLGYHSHPVKVKEDTFLTVFLHSKKIPIGDVTVRAYSSNQKAFETPAAIEVLNSTQIKKLSVASPSTVINSLPGLYMHNGARNTNRITIRGIGSRSMYTTTKIKAYLNEIPITSGIGETTLEDFDLDLVDRITVLKGPSPSIYGAALGGSILYRIGTPEEQGLTVKQQATVGSYNLFKNTSKISWQGNQTSIKIAYNKLNDDGFRLNDNYKRDGITGIIQHQLTEDIGITYIGRYHKLKAYIPSSLNEETFIKNPEKAAENWSAVNGNEAYSKALNGLSLNIDLLDNFSARSSLFMKHYEGREIRPFNILDDNSITAGTRNLVQWEKKTSELRLMAQTGFELLYETYEWKIYETLTEGNQGALLNKNSQYRVHRNFFTSLETKWKKFKLSTGVNLNKAKYQYDDLLQDSTDLSDQKTFQWVVSPRLSLNYQFSDRLMVFGTVGHGFSTPSYEETLNAEGYVTGSVKPETGWNRETGVRFKDRNHGLFFKITGYSVTVKNLLVTKRLAEDEFYKINAGETMHNGLEISFSSELLNNKILNSSTNMSYMLSDYKFENFTDDGNDYSGNNLPGIPKHKLFVQLETDFKIGAYITANLIWSDSMPMNDENSIDSDPYGKLNLKAGIRRSLSKNWLLHVYTGIHNVTDANYASMILINAPSFGGEPPRYYYPGVPRNYFGGVSVSYSFDK